MVPNSKSPGDAWTVASAKAHLSQVITQAQMAPQTITRNGRPSVVIVSMDEWQRRSERKGSLATFLLESPLAGADLIDAERAGDAGRPIEL